MPSLGDHVRLSISRTGKGHHDLHEWMDGRNTRLRDIIARHNMLNVPRLLPVVEEQFGEEGAREFLHHLEDDYRAHLILRIWRRIARIRGRAPPRALLRQPRG